MKGDFNGGIYNIASGKETFIKDAVSLFFENLGWKGEYSFKGENRQGDPTNWVADVSSLEGLGFKSKYSFEKGLENYCGWLREKR